MSAANDNEYARFVAGKLATQVATGLTGEFDLSGYSLMPHQSDLTGWALRRGRCAIFADTGLGKTRMQLAWANEIHKATGRDVLILAPLAVAAQTVAEGAEIGVTVTHCRELADVQPGVNITNYDRLHKFDASRFGAIVLDESSCIKHHDTKTLATLLDAFKATPFRLCATATPAPNDWTELGTHAEFLGVCSRVEMLSEYFVHDGAETQVWRLKGHARSQFWKWVSGWGAMVRKPSDLGHDDAAYNLPGLTVSEHTVASTLQTAGQLFAFEAQTLSERRDARRASMSERTSACVDLISEEKRHVVEAGVRGITQGEGAGESGQEEESAIGENARNRAKRLPGHADSAERQVRDLRLFGRERSEDISGGGSLPRDGEDSRPALHELQSGLGEIKGQRKQFFLGDCLPAEKWLIWVELNDEQDQIENKLREAGISYVSIRGSTELDLRIKMENEWRTGNVQCMVSKPSVFGWGLNWQHCARMAFVGVTDSFEAYYQAVRRCWRFGQRREVAVHIFASELEGAVVANLKRKEADAMAMAESLSAETRDAVRAEVFGSVRQSNPYNPRKPIAAPSWLVTEKAA